MNQLPLTDEQALSLAKSLGAIPAAQAAHTDNLRRVLAEHGVDPDKIQACRVDGNLLSYQETPHAP